jgi:hypothetical protein
MFSLKTLARHLASVSLKASKIAVEHVTFYRLQLLRSVFSFTLSLLLTRLGVCSEFHKGVSAQDTG